MSYYDQPVHLCDDDDPSDLREVTFVAAPPDHDFDCDDLDCPTCHDIAMQAFIEAVQQIVESR